MDKEKNREEIAGFLASMQADMMGIGDLSLYDREFLGLDKSVVDRYTFSISFGFVLVRGVLDTIEGGPNSLYLHHYRQLNYRLDMTAYLLAKSIEKQGYRALPFAASQLVDWQNQKAHISHKRIGEISGIGWVGRNNLLIHPRYGARGRYNTILTDLPLTPDTPLQDSCGECRACLSSCPAGAIRETQEEFDHLGCFNMLKKFRNERNIGHYICGICIEACKGRS
jgi:epoxyqueuosine reductase